MKAIRGRRCPNTCRRCTWCGSPEPTPLQPGRCLLAIHAHPDDESITTGGTLALCAARGIRTVLVTCTNGDLGIMRPTGSTEPAGAIRSAELRQAATLLGISRLVQLDYGDSGMAGTPENLRPACFHQIPLPEAAARIEALLREEQPDIVVTYDEDGGYGHPDHVKAHQVALAAFDGWGPQASTLQAVVWPRSVIDRYVKHMASSGLMARPQSLAGIENDIDASHFGTPDELVSGSLEVRAYIDLKWRALAAHRSQTGTEHPLLRMSPTVRDDIWGMEYFRRLRP